jgi:hypothetical protein
MTSQWAKLSTGKKAAVIGAFILILSYSLAVMFILLNYHVGDWRFFPGLPLAWGIYMAVVNVAKRG